MSTTTVRKVAIGEGMTCLDAFAAAYLNFSPRYTPVLVEKILEAAQKYSPTVQVKRPDGSQVSVPWSASVRDAFDLPPEATHVDVLIQVLESDIADSRDAKLQNLLDEHMRETLDTLPDEIKDFFFRFDWGGVPLTAGDFGKFMEIANKLNGLSDAELEDYWARTFGDTDDIDAFGKAIDLYLERLEYKKKARNEHIDAKNALFGQEDLWRTYYLAKLADSTPGDQIDKRADLLLPKEQRTYQKFSDAKSELPGKLAEWNYENVEEFEQKLETFRKAFQSDAIVVAQEAMEYRQHELWEFGKSALTEENTDSLFAALAPMRDKKDASPEVLRRLLDDIASGTPELKKLIDMLRSEFEDGQLDQAIIQQLAEAQNPQVFGYCIGNLIEERHKAIDRTRKELKEDPDLIWHFEKAVAQAKLQAGISADSIHDEVIRDHIDNVKLAELTTTLALAAASIVAGLVAMGPGGALARTAATVVSVFASGYDVMDTFASYDRDQNARLAGMSLNDPHIAWVLLSLLGLALDALSLFSGLAKVANGRRLSKAEHIAKMLEDSSPTGEAVRRFGDALEKVRGADDVEVAERFAKQAKSDLKRDLTWADAALKKTIIETADKELAAAVAMARLKATYSNGATPMIDLADPKPGWEDLFSFPICVRLRAGARDLGKFLETRDAKQLIGEFDDLENVGKQRVVLAYLEAVDQWDRIAKRADELGLGPEHLDEAFRRWSLKPEMSGKTFISDVLDKMNVSDELTGTGEAWKLEEALKIVDAHVAAEGNLKWTDWAGRVSLALQLKSVGIAYETFTSDNNGSPPTDITVPQSTPDSQAVLAALEPDKVAPILIAELSEEAEILTAIAAGINRWNLDELNDNKTAKINAIVRNIVTEPRTYDIISDLFEKSAPDIPERSVLMGVLVKRVELEMARIARGARVGPDLQPPPIKSELSASVGRGGVNVVDDVTSVQQLLNDTGANLQVDGLVGRNTWVAIRNLQREKLNVSGDGRVDPGRNTWRVLNGRDAL